MVSMLTDVVVDGQVKLLTGLALKESKTNLNIHITVETTLAKVTQVHSKPEDQFKFQLEMNNNSELPLKKNQSQFVLMPQIGVNIKVVFSTIVVQTLTTPSYLPVIKMDNTGTLKTHGLLHGVKLVTSD